MMAIRLSSATPCLHRPVDGVEQVVVHLAAPLQVAGIDEALAEAGRAAEVHRQHRIAAVRQPLVARVEAIAVARPRAAVHQQHHRQRRLGLRLFAGRQRQVRHQLQTVARADDLAAHRRQPIGREIGARGEQLGDLGRAAVVEMIGGRRLRRARHHDPAAVVAACGRRCSIWPGSAPCSSFSVIGHVLVERYPVERHVLGAGGLGDQRLADAASTREISALGCSASTRSAPVRQSMVTSAALSRPIEEMR